MLPFIIGGAALVLIWAASQTDTVKNVGTSIQFVLKYWNDALASQAATGVPAIVTIAQAGLESNWGKSAPGFNFFGIKAGSTWKGEVQELKTWECGSTGNATKDGIKDRIIEIYPPGSSQGNSSCNARGYYSYRVYGKFRRYSSAAEAFTDHGRFLRDNKRYSRAFDTSTPQAFITEVHKAGYATDPLYSSKVIKLMDAIREVLDRSRLA